MKTTIRLSQSQLQVISFIAQYRFIQVRHIQRAFNLTSRTSVHRKLTILVDAGYLGMQYDKTYKLRGRSASFYVTPKALRYMQAQGTASYIDDSVVKSSYRDKSASEITIDHHLMVLDWVQSLQAQYPGMKCFTPRQLGRFEYMPKPLPDLYLALKKHQDTQRYFLFRYKASTPAFALRQQIGSLMNYIDQAVYDVTGNELPMILAACDTPGMERQVQRAYRQQMSKAGVYADVMTTSSRALKEGAATDSWTELDDPEPRQL